MILYTRRAEGADPAEGRRPLGLGRPFR